MNQTGLGGNFLSGFLFGGGRTGGVGANVSEVTMSVTTGQDGPSGADGVNGASGLDGPGGLGGAGGSGGLGGVGASATTRVVSFSTRVAGGSATATARAAVEPLPLNS